MNMPNNKGFSLVELIVAVSVGTIMAGSVAALIIFSLRMYRNESVRTNLQYELQTNVDQVMDSVISSSWIYIKDDATAGITDSASFGNYVEIVAADDSVSRKYTGEVFVCTKEDPTSTYYCLYMDRVEYAIDDSLAENAIDDFIKGSIETTVNTIKSATGNAKKIYLLGENVKKFDLAIADGCLVDSDHYTNPMAINVELTFADKSWNGEPIEKHVEDVAYLRNYVGRKIYVDGAEYIINE